LRRLAVVLLLLPWLIWLPSALGTGIMPQGWDAWVLFTWPLILLVLLVCFPAQWNEPASLAIVVGVLALTLPLVESWLTPYRPLTDREVAAAIIGGGTVILVMTIIGWSYLNLALARAVFMPPMVKFSTSSTVGAALSPRLAFHELRYVPMRDTPRAQAGAADAEGWFPVWSGNPWEEHIEGRLPLNQRADFIGPRRPHFFARILSEGPLEQRLEMCLHTLPMVPDIFTVHLKVEPRAMVVG
jgi:hypothetical protein